MTLNACAGLQRSRAGKATPKAPLLHDNTHDCTANLFATHARNTTCTSEAEAHFKVANIHKDEKEHRQKTETGCMHVCM